MLRREGSFVAATRTKVYLFSSQRRYWCQPRLASALMPKNSFVEVSKWPIVAFSVPSIGSSFKVMHSERGRTYKELFISRHNATGGWLGCVSFAIFYIILLCPLQGRKYVIEPTPQSRFLRAKSRGRTFRRQLVVKPFASLRKSSSTCSIYIYKYLIWS